MSDFNYQLSLTNVKWTSIEPLTKSDIEKMRSEFWDTASAYEGHKDTWDLLKKCVEQVHQGHSDKAQEILLFNGIIVPEGTLSECYNELGHKFEIPDYVLSYPTNLQTNEQSQHAKEIKETGKYYNTAKIRLSDSRLFTIQVSRDDTIGMLKSKLEGPCNVPAVDQRWYFGGKFLQNDVPIMRYNIDSCNVIQAIIHKPKKPAHMK